MKKEKSKGRLVLPIIIEGLGYVVAGAFLGIKTGGVTKGFLGFVLLFIMSLFVFVLFVAATALAHEAGHMIFGLLTGYEFSSFRIGSWMFTKTKDGIKFKKFSIPGTVGQCLMKPPAVATEERERGEYPYVMYDLGGCLVNFIIAVITGVLAVIFWDNGIIGGVLASFAVLNFTLGLSNVLPLKSGLSTDGNNLSALRKSKGNRREFWIQLYLNAHLTEGGNYRELPEEFITVPENLDYSSYIQAAGRPICREAWLEEQGRYEEALELFEDLLEKANLIEIHEFEVRAAVLVLKALLGYPKEEILDGYSDKALRTYCATAKGYMVNKQVLMYALSLITAEDEEKPKWVQNPEAQFKEYEKVAAKYPYEAEKAIAAQMINDLKEKYVK